jgi:hypothetical protein
VIVSVVPTEDRQLTRDVLAFILSGLVEERIHPAVACSLVAPWVAGGEVSDEPMVEWIAQSIHGFDMVTLPDGLVAHQSDGAAGTLVRPIQEVAREAARWLDEVRISNRGFTTATRPTTRRPDDEAPS